uniref:Putative secreted protein n=1 Tax=Anopheles darlingi TaxID=43151 RepID=A0A2M4DPH6_ANODA
MCLLELMICSMYSGLLSRTSGVIPTQIRWIPSYRPTLRSIIVVISSDVLPKNMYSVPMKGYARGPGI